MKPSFDDGWAKLYTADAVEALKAMPEKSVHMAVTSPPYFGLRSYLPADHPDKAKEGGTQKTPQEYVAWLVEVMREVGRVLRDDGTLWLNLGDSYAGGKGGRTDANRPNGQGVPQTKTVKPELYVRHDNKVPPGMKPKDLMMIPARAAIALCDDGWTLRADIIWAKANCMPESVTDRPTRSHEHLFLLSKSPRYFYDSEAIKEKGSEPRELSGDKAVEYANGTSSHKQPYSSGPTGYGTHGSRNKRDVWHVNPRPYKGSHYAVFPPELVIPCIKAGTSEKGCCSECGAPWRRVTTRASGFTDGFCNGCGESRSKHKQGPKSSLRSQDWGQRMGETAILDDGAVACKSERTVAWEPTCSHDAQVEPATVLDPFMGSGTTAVTARKLGRKSVGIDLDERNLTLLEERLGWQGVLL